MSAQALYRKWRPQLWEEVVGQEHVVQTLRNALRTDHVAHAYLFSGPRGCGKTTSARLIAKAVNCLHPDPAQRPDNTCAHCLAVTEGRFLDLVEIDGASNNGVENIRELREKINFAPGEGRSKVYIIDEVHMLSGAAFNALLKTLEEPPPHAIFILATTEIHKIPATVSSRCQRFEFRRIPSADIAAHLKQLCQQESLEVEDAALDLVARQSTGSLRDAISLLDQLVSGSSTVTLAQAQDLLGASASQSVQTLVDSLAAQDLGAGLSVVNAAVDGGVDPRQMARQVVDYARQLMMVRLGNAGLVEASAEARAALARQAELLDVPALLRVVRAFNTAANDSRGGWQPQLPLELAVVECASPAPELASAPSAPAAAATRQPAASPRAETRPAVTRPASAAPARRAAADAPRPASARPDAPAAIADAPDDPPGDPPEEPPDLPAEAYAASEAAPEAPAPLGPPVAMAQADVRARWNQLLAAMRKRDHGTQVLLNSCSLIGLEGGVLRLSTSDFVIGRIAAGGDTRALIEDMASQVFGFVCKVKIEESGKGEAPKRGAAGRDHDIPRDGLVATALDLGGEIVE